MFRIHPTFIDIFAILMAVFMLISVIMAKEMKREYLTKVDMLKKTVEQKAGSRPDTETISLSVVPKDEGRYEFVLYSKKTGKKVIDTVTEVKQELSKIRPAKISLRIDRTVPTGITQELIYDAQELQILPYLTVERK